jgi:endo-1,3-1,4-beta-glycanase ExoK
MRTILASSLLFMALGLIPRSALAVKSGELYTKASHPFGRFEASIKFPPGDGIVGAFFLWKAGSEVAGTFWNELDFEKVGAACQLESNAFYGNPATVHAQRHTPATLLCGTYHTYAFEWTPTYLAWFVDGVELRRETGAAASAYADNATAGMQLRFNIWPGDASFGGNFDPSTLPAYEEIDWVQYSSFANDKFTLEWRDDFEVAALDPRWLVGNWDSPKGLSQHAARNIGIIDGHAIIALTSDEGVGTGVPPQPTGAGGMGGGGAGVGGSAGLAGAGGAGGAGGSMTGGGAGGSMTGGGAGGSMTGGGAGGSMTGGVGSVGGATSGGAGGSSSSGAPGAGTGPGSSSGGSDQSMAGSPVGSTGQPSQASSCAATPGRTNGPGAWLLAVTLGGLVAGRWPRGDRASKRHQTARPRA